MNNKHNNLHDSVRNRLLISILIMVALNLCFYPPANSSASISLPLLAAAGVDERKPSEIEYEVKAAFIYNFMKFVEWPENKKDNPEAKTYLSEPITIGILGTNPFGKAFEPILHKKVGERKIQLVEIESFEAFQKRYADTSYAAAEYKKKYGQVFQKCEIIFISQTEKNQIDTLLKLLAQQAILTISDMPGFSEKGGIVGFVTDDEKVRFEINLDTAKQEKIQISSQLLRLAKRVYTKKN